jgi:hypothetical protein
LTEWRLGRSLSDLDDRHQAATALLLGVVVDRVVGNVAVQQPLAWLASFPDHVVAFAGADVDCVLEQLRIWPN